MNKNLRKILVCAVSVLMVNVALAQETNEKSKDPNQRKADKKKMEQLANQQRAEEKAKKRHMAIQTKDTRKRMKKSAKKARKNNENREFFLFKPFKKKH